MSPEELLEAVRHLPDLVRDVAISAADLEDLPDRDGITEVVILGTGPGRVAGDVVEALAEFHGEVPVVATGARCPAWVGEGTLAVVVSFAGESAPGIAAAEIAAEAGARMLVVTTEGGLSEWATDHCVAAVRVDPESGPAAGLGVAIVPILVLLERLGLATGMSRLISGVAEQLEVRRRAIDEDRSQVDAIAAAVRGRVAVVCGAGAIGKNAARRWVQELDRVGGVAAVRRRLPVNSEDVATWARLADQVSGGLVAIVLRHDFEPEGLIGGRDLISEAVESVHEVEAQGDGVLAQLLDLVLVADAVVAAVRSVSGS
jgi:hypothetical protein